MGQRHYTTGEAAKKIGVSRQTLQTWIAAKKIKAPELTRPIHVRFWTEAQIARLKAARPYLPRKRKGEAIISVQKKGNSSGRKLSN